MVLKHQSFRESWDKKKNIKQKLGETKVRNGLISME